MGVRLLGRAMLGQMVVAVIIGLIRSHNMYVRMYMYMYPCMYVCVSVCICIHIYVYSCMRVYVYMHM